MASPSPQAYTCLNFITHLLIAFKDTLMNLFLPERIQQEVEKLPQTTAQIAKEVPKTIASFSSSSRQVTYQVFLSFRGEDTRFNFTSHLHKALKDKGMNVFFDEEKLERGKELSPALSQAIAASNLSVIVLSKDYASSKSCLAELSDIMERKKSQEHIVLPIFYHVDPSHVRNIGGTFKTSFEEHVKKGLPQLKQRKMAFAKVGKLKGWHITTDKPETEYIKEIVDDVTKKLMNIRTSRTFKQDKKEPRLLGIEGQKGTILRMIEGEENRIIGLWGEGGIGKTTLADAVFKASFREFQNHYFLQNVREKMEKQGGQESLRNELLSNLLNEKDIRIDTPSIGFPYEERMNEKKVLVVLDDVSDPSLIEYLGIEHFRHGSKIIVTSRDRQVLISGGVDKIHAVNKLNEEDSFQLFSKYAFHSLNPAEEFLDLSKGFLESAQGNPLALRVLGSGLQTKTTREWESELAKLKRYADPKLSQILQSSIDGLGELEKDIFLDIAIFYKWEPKEEVEAILSGRYGEGVVSGISSLHDKCLLETGYFGTFYDGRCLHRLTMHDMLEEMGKAIVRRKSENPFKRSRLWDTEDVVRLLKYNKGTDDIVGIKLDWNPIDKIQLHPCAFENMYNLKYICFNFVIKTWENPFAVEVDNIPHIPEGLRLLQWLRYPFKSLSSSFSPKNLGFINLSYGDMEQLWSSEDAHLVNLRGIDVSYCKNLRKIPNLSGATKLKIFKANGCESLVELPCLNHCELLDKIEFYGCKNLGKFPEFPNRFPWLHLSGTRIQEVPDSIEHLVGLVQLEMVGSYVKKVSSNISKLESLRSLNLSGCPITEFPETPRSLTELFLSRTPIRKLQCNPTLYVLDAKDCGSLEEVSFPDQKSYQFDPSDDYCGRYVSFMFFGGCFRLNQDSVGNIEANAMFKIECLAKKWAWQFAQRERERERERENEFCEPRAFACYYMSHSDKEFVCCFPSDLYLANKFEHQSENSSISFKISHEECGRGKFLAFSIYLVADLTNIHRFGSYCTCEYKLTTIGGVGHKKFTSKWVVGPWCEADHVLILFGRDMIRKDKNYEEASFKFKIYSRGYREVKKCGVHVSYVDTLVPPSPTHNSSCVIH